MEMGSEYFPATARRGYTLYPFELVGFEKKGRLCLDIWNVLSSSEGAVLIVLGSYINRAGWSFPGEVKIAAMAGLTCKTVRKAIRRLEHAQLIEIHRRTTCTGKSAQKYKWLLPRSGDNLFRIPHTLIDGGGWRKLPPASKKLYLAFRFLGRPNPALDPEFDEDAQPHGDWLGHNPDLRREYLTERKVDYCLAPRLSLCDFAGISYRHFKRALKGLSDAQLVSIVSPGCYEVAIEPRQLFDAAILNAEIRDKGGVY